jgi:hypothetical protein
METTDSYSLQWKKDEAWRAHQRRLKLDPTERYRVPIYHIGLISYLRWTLAALLPNPIDDTPITWGHVDYEACLKSYGRHRTLSDIIDFLQDLLGKKFTEAYGFDAGAVDYQYLVDKIDDIAADLLERERPIPRGIIRATSWLNEQIEHLHATRLKEIESAEQAALNADSATNEAVGPHSSYEILTTTHALAAEYVAAEQMEVENEPIEEEIVQVELTEAEQIEPEQVAAELTHPSDPWEGIFRNYTLAKLNNLLVFVGLLDTANPITIAEYTRPGQWAAVISALIKAKRVTDNRTTVGEAFCKTYGDETVSISTCKRPHQKSFNELYSNALSRIMQE